MNQRKLEARELADAHVVELPKISDTSGNLTFIEGNKHIPFTVQRAFWLYDVPGGAVRAGHAHHKLQEFIICLSGSFEVVFDDGKDRKRFFLNRPQYGIHVPGMVWRTLENFSSNAVALVLASLPYEDSDYIRTYEEFKKLVGAQPARSRRRAE